MHPPNLRQIVVTGGGQATACGATADTGTAECQKVPFVCLWVPLSASEYRQQPAISAMPLTSLPQYYRLFRDRERSTLSGTETERRQRRTARPSWTVGAAGNGARLAGLRAPAGRLVLSGCCQKPEDGRCADRMMADQ